LYLTELDGGPDANKRESYADINRFPVGRAGGLYAGCGAGSGLRLTGENYLNHVAIAVENFDAAFAFYTQKMGFREAFTVRDANGRPNLAYVQVSRNTFIELQQANANRHPV
jgi:hypothetical protein